jgi:hypothetical protein
MDSNKRISNECTNMTKTCSACKWETTVFREDANALWKFSIYICNNPNCGLVQTYATPIKIGGIS